MQTGENSVGSLLREWRATRGMSQLDLAHAASVSSRHVSFIETGRSKPSREMVQRLSESLDVPLRERNALLVAAGFAPVYREHDLDHAALGPVRRALELVLTRHEPFPAFVLDRGWNVLLSNAAHRRLLERLLPDADHRATVNVIRLVLDPALLRPRIANWEIVAHVLGHRLQRQLRTPTIPPAAREQLESMLAFPGVTDAMQHVTAPPESAIVIPLQIDDGERRLSWFSTIATIGTPQDVTLDELRIESLFPADDETEAIARALADPGD